jgi:hypothetical protein
MPSYLKFLNHVHSLCTMPESVATQAEILEFMPVSGGRRA